LGYGKIGRSVHDAFDFFGANVKFHDPFVKGGCELNDVLRDADLVSVHVPLSDETKHLLGKQRTQINEIWCDPYKCIKRRYCT
jgi:phosphoglycerate dehydrogenase-like enzyme